MLKSIAALTLVSAMFVAPAWAQPDRTGDWQTALVLAKDSKRSLDRRAEDVATVRRQVTEWLALNPGIPVTLDPTPERPQTEQQLLEQIVTLEQAIAAIVQRDPNQPFYLGSAVVDVTAPAATISPVVDTLDGTDIQRRRALTVAQAIEYLPGVSVDHKAPRHQSGISIGGFDSRQVPLYLDGIPAYVPFDGFVDLSRYLTTDVAEVQVAKGYSSPLLGPNVLGGVVNVVTRQPRSAIEGDGSIGTASGHQFDTGIHAGGRWQRFFAQGSADLLSSDFYPLAGGFQAIGVQRDDRRVNSDQRDERYRLRLGWTPRGRDEYVASYSNQNGRTGIPPYAGTAPACPAGAAATTEPCVTPKFWRWPYWDTDSYYFNSKTGLGSANEVRVRAFYSTYANRMDMFDDGSYTTMNLNASSGRAANRDHSVGVSGTFQTLVVPHQVISASAFVKNDTHTEVTTTFSRANNPTTTPEQQDRDRQSSFGIEDVITLAPTLKAHVGISADQLDGLQAQDLSANRATTVPFQVPGICEATTGFDSCTDHVWAYNPVAALTYGTERAGSLFVSYARKSRFPTLKDRYSYKAGRAIPNPELRPERARTWTAGYSRTIAARTVGQVDVFRSDVRDEIENVFFLSTLCPATTGTGISASGGGGGGGGGGRGGAGTCQQAVNVGSELHDGINLSARTTAAPRLTIDGSYSFLHREISGTSGLFSTGTPRHKFVATATARLPIEGSAVFSVRHQSGIAAMSDNGLALPEARFTVMDAGATIPVSWGLSVQGGVRNLSDRNYYYWEGFPEAGRTFYITLRFDFENGSASSRR